ncbi:sporulation protein YabP [Alkaliphilus oremlandii]|uniref:YabP family protein n=1 Tax=Alkaliphilus oremlandii (strain OhILAs) TaxID=350688 RepID=A8MK33_ALKOO|nr:sporulation protein YabP [Alkaliphilus oremlandii]ABW20165.1 YabP family protein [Alkaliphilus oremlandii OhILAs]
MEDRRTTRARNHSIMLENREKLNVSGVEHVNSFNSELVILETIAGVLTIKGEELDISKLNVEDGNVSVSGTIYALNYSDRESIGAKGAGFLGRMFK